ncbi:MULTISPECIES: hypothetical protein [unclassified Neorhizobium]|uniref:hypothetical protein n=1 Tax=unclassified Neorhizobium TaxID=2629175 RepID=UPI001FF162C6|nr:MULTISPECIES: hypothetical protein [unclassified Neorhizobium]MCJ9672158.1 hypothetical protein [Neorhizobium sp. SHOUNA12B]MCJ9748035.1 hypothetical protein [Neorhizobium sp. SHOUNA12A]
MDFIQYPQDAAVYKVPTHPDELMVHAKNYMDNLLNIQPNMFLGVGNNVLNTCQTEMLNKLAEEFNGCLIVGGVVNSTNTGPIYPPFEATRDVLSVNPLDGEAAYLAGGNGWGFTMALHRGMIPIMGVIGVMRKIGKHPWFISGGDNWLITFSEPTAKLRTKKYNDADIRIEYNTSQQDSLAATKFFHELGQAELSHCMSSSFLNVLLGELDGFFVTKARWVTTVALMAVSRRILPEMSFYINNDAPQPSTLATLNRNESFRLHLVTHELGSRRLHRPVG